MKVALLHYSAPPVVGGVESVLAHHARLMADAGHTVCILAGRGRQTDPRLKFAQLPLADSRHPEILEAKAVLDQGRVPEQFEQLVERLFRALSDSLAGVSLLIAHNVCSLNKNLPLTAALRRFSLQAGTPRLVLWHHDLAWTTPRYRHELHPGYPWDLLRVDWPEVAQVVVSRLRQEELAELLGAPLTRIRVVPNGVDVAQFLHLSDQTMQLVRKLDLLAASPLLLLPVRITPRKNIELALRVLAALRQDYPHARLVVTGPLGPHNPSNVDYFARLVALRAELGLQSAAHFLAEHSQDFLPDEVVADFYRLAAALFFPSQEEGFGIPILEAGLARLPIFCADIPPLRELAGEQAAFFPPGGSPQQVAALLAGSLSSYPTFAMQARVLQNYTWERVYARHIAPLLEMI